MAILFFEYATPSDCGTLDVAALADAWAAMAVRDVLEPDLDDILGVHLELLSGARRPPRYPRLAAAGPPPE